MQIERLESGIPGLDELIEGGFVRNSVNLLSGGTGTGKTTFAAQFILHGLKKGENGVYISLEQKPDEIKADLVRFGMDFNAYIRSGRCILEYLAPRNFDELKFEIYKRISQTNAKRFVLDNISLMVPAFEEKSQAELRQKIFDLIRELKAKDVTAILVSEIPEDDEKRMSRFGVEEFIVDGVVKLGYFGIGREQFRNLEVRKMRRTNHAKGSFQLEFTKNGLEVFTDKFGNTNS